MARSAGRVSTAVSVNSATSPSSVASSVRFAPSPSPAAPTAKFPIAAPAYCAVMAPVTSPPRGRHPRLVRAPVGQRRGEHGHPEVIRERRGHPGEEREREEVSAHRLIQIPSPRRRWRSTRAVAAAFAAVAAPRPPSPLPRPPFPRRPRATRQWRVGGPRTHPTQHAFACVGTFSSYLSARVCETWGRLDDLGVRADPDNPLALREHPPPRWRSDTPPSPPTRASTPRTRRPDERSPADSTQSTQPRWPRRSPTRPRAARVILRRLTRLTIRFGEPGEPRRRSTRTTDWCGRRYPRARAHHRTRARVRVRQPPMRRHRARAGRPAQLSPARGRGEPRRRTASPSRWRTSGPSWTRRRGETSSQTRRRWCERGGGGDAGATGGVGGVVVLTGDREERTR